MEPRTVEDNLREEYAHLLADLRRAADELEAEVRYLLIPIIRTMEPCERLIVKSRVKECESAIEALRRRQETKTFNARFPTRCSLKSLNDLAGIRVLAFPKRLVLQIDSRMRARFPEWKSDPVMHTRPEIRPLALKYHGYCSPESKIRSELQIVPMLIGLFWEVEHAALYKPPSDLRGRGSLKGLGQRNDEVIVALEAFEEQFEALRQYPPETLT